MYLSTQVSIGFAGGLVLTFIFCDLRLWFYDLLISSFNASVSLKKEKLS